MPTYSALTTLEGKAGAEALGEALEQLEPTGVGVFEVEDDSGLWEVGAYFLDAPDGVSLDLMAAAFGAKPFVVSEVPDVDWVAKVRRELQPVQAGRFFVYGSHDADMVPTQAEPLLIEAAMAFGTGHHGTTKGCLEAFDRLLDRGERFDRVADIGCGTAVLAMAAARVLPGTIIAADIDPVAVEVAEANVIANGLGGRVTCLEATGFDHEALENAAPYDLIFANILKAPLIELAPAMARHTALGGKAILSGILTHQADEVAEVYALSGFNVDNKAEIVDWVTLTLSR
ncbi:MAG: 50S ribosomal protein L11 methyltransferase [Rhodobacteraceae bacterium]|nr:50S ribosomal protein L11 methyltransferase [Paracoccaceae bacterium]